MKDHRGERSNKCKQCDFAKHFSQKWPKTFFFFCSQIQINLLLGSGIRYQVFDLPLYPRFLQLANMFVNVVLGIWYLFSHHTLVSILLRFIRFFSVSCQCGIRYQVSFNHRTLVHILPSVIYLINMFVNAVLGIRYLFSQRTLVPILLRFIRLTNMFVNVVLGIRYFLTIVPQSISF